MLLLLGCARACLLYYCSRSLDRSWSPTLSWEMGIIVYQDPCILVYSYPWLFGSFDIRREYCPFVSNKNTIALRISTNTRLALACPSLQRCEFLHCRKDALVQDRKFHLLLVSRLGYSCLSEMEMISRECKLSIRLHRRAPLLTKKQRRNMKNH